jgi:3-oxoadipate enol-lactonase
MLLTENLRVPVPAGELYVERAGEGPAVVLLHAGALDASMWDSQIAALVEGHTVVRFDARGHGRSSTPTADWHPDDDLLAVLDAMELERATLVGNSFGAATAVDFALTRPERVRSLVLVGPGINPMRFEDPFVLRLHQAQADAIAALDADAYIEAFLRFGVDGPQRTPEQAPAAVREACREMALRTVHNHRASVGRMLGRDAADRLEEVTAPVLLVAGELEMPDVLRVVADAHRRMPRAERTDVPAVGHMVSMEQPDVFDRVLLAHLAQHS